MATCWSFSNCCWTVVLVLCSVVSFQNGKSSAEKTSTTPMYRDPAPLCFTRYNNSVLGTWAFKAIRADSIYECAKECTNLRDDRDDAKICRSFDHNLRKKICRFFSHSVTDPSVRMGTSVKLDVYNLNEDCWRNTHGPSTVPPNVNACDHGTKPVMEKVGGWSLKSSGMSFKDVSEKTCYESCLHDRMPNRKDRFKCLSVSYNRDKQTCVYLNTIARPLNKHGPELTSDSSYNYYAKLCLPANATSSCSKGYVTRFINKQLVGMNDAQITTKTYADCVKACLTADKQLGMNCKSGMFYNKKSSENCVLNYADHYEEPSLLIDEQDLQVDYFSVNSCSWGSPK